MTIVACLSRQQLSEERMCVLRQFGDVTNVSNEGQIDRGRWRLLGLIWERALHEPVIWIDDDVHIDAQIVDGLHHIRDDVGCAIYNVRNSHEIACEPLEAQRSDGLIPLRWCHFGATILRPSVWKKMFNSTAPFCNGVPAYWAPIILPNVYLAEDVSFCRRAADCGVTMVANPNLICAHGWPEREYPSEAQVELFRQGKRESTGSKADPSLDGRVKIERFSPDEIRSLPAQYPGDSGGHWEFSRYEVSDLSDHPPAGSPSCLPGRAEPALISERTAAE